MLNYEHFWFLGVFGVIFELLKYFRMPLLIFVNSKYSFSLNFFDLRPPYMTFWMFHFFWECLQDLWVFFFQFSKMWFLICFNSDYSLFFQNFDLRTPSKTFYFLNLWFLWVFGKFLRFWKGSIWNIRHQLAKMTFIIFKQVILYTLYTKCS